MYINEYHNNKYIYKLYIGLHPPPLSDRVCSNTEIYVYADKASIKQEWELVCQCAGIVLQ